jgi:hypothetical protein
MVVRAPASSTAHMAKQIGAVKRRETGRFFSFRFARRIGDGCAMESRALTRVSMMDFLLCLRFFYVGR